jgi:Ca2+-transporting ATPase
MTDTHKRVVARALDLGTDLYDGLTADQVARNRQLYGGNDITPARKEPLWRQFLRKFDDPTIRILLVCAVLSLAAGVYKGASVGDWLGIAESAGILVAALIATGVGFLLEWRADRAFDLLRKEYENLIVKVTRDGRFKTVPVGELVTGDLVHLENGNKVPADGWLVATSNLTVDQSFWSGETEPAAKDGMDDPDDKRGSTFLVGGTNVVGGSGTMLTVAVGDASERGIIIRDIQTTKREQTPLERKLQDLADVINIAGTGASVLIFTSVFTATALRGRLGGPLAPVGRTVLSAAVITIISTLVVVALTKGRRQHHLLVPAFLSAGCAVFAVVLASVFAWGTPFAGQGTALANLVTGVVSPTLEVLILAVTIVVIAVPEGLPMAVSISLALSARNIRKDNNLVRKMIAAETIGSADVIFSDKTGTMTLNRMSLATLYTQGRLYERDPEDGQTGLGDVPVGELLALGVAANSTCHLDERGGGEPHFVGSSTEGALLKWLQDRGIMYGDLRERHPAIRREDFSSQRKIMSTVVRHGDAPWLLVKGAPERVLERCTDIETTDGRTESLGGHEPDVERVLASMAEREMRTLAFAYRRMESDTDVREDGLTLQALAGIVDPVRTDVPAAVATAHRAGIDVKMVTGDSPATARAVATRAGVWSGDALLLTGEQFAAMSDDELRAVAPRLKILARSEPMQKKRLVEILQSLGHVVAVTGDGTNDAPALKTADVGISMGLRGTDVAKEASDIVLVDDNFGSIVRAVHWGRTLYENIQKFLQFQLSINLSALTIAFISPLLALGTSLLARAGVQLLPHADFREMPLTILQLLWINLIMDTLAALALSLEPKRAELMNDRPKRRTESFVTHNMLHNILVMSTWFITVTLSMQATGWYLGVDNTNTAQVSSVVFTSYVFMQVFNLFNARSVRPDKSAFAGLKRSTTFWAVVTVIIVIQVGLTQFGGATFSTAPLPSLVWLRVLALGLATVAVGEASRAFRRFRYKAAHPADAGVATP